MKNELFDEKFENIDLNISPKEIGGNGFSQLIEQDKNNLKLFCDKNI